jgi:hypothetical protein
MVALAHPEMGRWSSRKLADHCGVSDEFVRRLKPEVLPTVGNATVTCADGREYPARREPRPTDMRIEPASKPDRSGIEDNPTLLPDPPRDPLPGQAEFPEQPEEPEPSESDPEPAQTVTFPAPSFGPVESMVWDAFDRWPQASRGVFAASPGVELEVPGTARPGLDALDAVAPVHSRRW